MNRPHIILSVERVGNRFFPGEVLVSGYRIEISPEQSVTAVEASVIWRTTGKGEEDFGVHFFERRPKQTLDASVLKRPHRISTVLPRSPLSYDGELIKIHWSVRVSVFVNGQQYSEDLPFMLGNTSLAEYEKLDA